MKTAAVIGGGIYVAGAVGLAAYGMLGHYPSQASAGEWIKLLLWPVSIPYMLAMRPTAGAALPPS